MPFNFYQLSRWILSCLFCWLIIVSPVFGAEMEAEEEIFKAKVIEVLEQADWQRADGSWARRQTLKLQGREGLWQGQEIVFDGQDDVLTANEYKSGDMVLVHRSLGLDGESDFYVIGFHRATRLYWLAALFALSVILVGRLKGVRSLLVLLLTFLVILKFIIPKILAGADPLLVSIVGALFILMLAVYITEGFKKTSTIAVVAILFTLMVAGLFSAWFAALARLSGFASEEAAYLIGLAGGGLNVKGLLLAGIIIGTLGVLDDVVISQVALVQELKNANPHLSKVKIYHLAMRVGVSHLSSMVNTLFLAYAGVSLPLLILFSIKQPPFLTFNQVLNNELVATEIVRTLAGSTALVLAVPIATFLAAHFIKHANQKA